LLNYGDGRSVIKGRIEKSSKGASEERKDIVATGIETYPFESRGIRHCPILEDG
jgi:hypothetical protein